MGDGLTRGELISVAVRLAAVTTLSYFTMKVRTESNVRTEDAFDT